MHVTVTFLLSVPRVRVRDCTALHICRRCHSETEGLHATVTFLLSVPRVRVGDCLQPYISVVSARVRVRDCVQPYISVFGAESES